MRAATFALVAMMVALAAAKTPQEWTQRRIYQVLTDRFARPSNETASCNFNEYCGGTFNAMADKLDYIAGMGFNAIWISPVVVNYPGGYHGYWATNFFKVNPHFGTEADLKAFVAKAQSMNIWIMIDIVVNHVGPVGMDFSQVYPFNQSSHYHQDCAVTQYQCNSEMVHHCRLANLPDLNQQNPFVQQQLQKYVLWLLSEFGFDGIRADTVMYIEQSYWAGLQSAANTFIAGEVWSDFSCNQIYTNYGVDATLNYPMYYAIRNAYQQKQSLYNLGTAYRQQKTLKNPGWEVNFIDNQDNDRFLQMGGVSDQQYRSALAYMFFMDGIPCVYYGTEDLFKGRVADNSNREPLWTTNYNTDTYMYGFLKNLSAAHEHFQPWNNQYEERWRDEQVYCFVRGMLLICTSNTPGQSQARTIPNLPFAGKQFCNWMNQGAGCSAGASTMDIIVPASGEPLILYGK